MIPADPVERAVAQHDRTQFHGTLATYSARLAYHDLLPHRDVMIEPFIRGKAALTGVIYPLQRPAIVVAPTDEQEYG